MIVRYREGKGKGDWGRLTPSLKEKATQHLECPRVKPARKGRRALVLFAVLFPILAMSCATFGPTGGAAGGAGTGGGTGGGAGTAVVGGAAEGDGAGRHIEFSGYGWDIIESPSRIGPGPNRFSSANVRLDERGRLLLSTRKDRSGWSCAEVFLDKSLSYGAYEVQILPIEGGLDARTVFGFYTWDGAPDFAHREIDIEIARWGEESAPNLNFAAQPSEGHKERAAVSEIDLASPITLRFEWRPRSLRFVALSGDRRVEWSFPSPSPADTIQSLRASEALDATGGPVATGEPGATSEPGGTGGPTVTGGQAAPGGRGAQSSSPTFVVPPEGDERVSFNLWLYQGRAPARPARIVISRFRYFPLPD